MQTNQNNYYDIEFDFEGIMLESGMVDEMFYLKDLKQRKLFLNEGISQSSETAQAVSERGYQPEFSCRSGQAHYAIQLRRQGHFC